MASKCSDHTITVAEYVDGGFRMPDVDKLQRNLHAETVANLPVVVVCLIGKCRTGKSFLLNHFVRFLKSKENCQDDGDLGSEDTALTGFVWGDGFEPITQGITMWNHIFKIRNGGKKVAVILCDTQGLFDGKMDTEAEHYIFSLAFATCSLLLFNIKEQITEENLRSLHEAIIAEKLGGDTSPKRFQQTLWLLVRDWKHKTRHKYGETGGKDYLQTTIQVINEDSSGENDVRRRDISEFFDDVRCFLLPYPGSKAAGQEEEEDDDEENEKEEFKGELKHLSRVFKKYVLEYCKSLFETDTLLCLKDEENQEMTCSDLYASFEGFTQNVTREKAMTPAEALKQAHFSRLCQQACETYKREMEKIINEGSPGLSSKELRDLHEKVLTSALQKVVQFLSKWPNEEQGGHEELDESIRERFEHYELLNSSKKGGVLELAILKYNKAFEENLAFWKYYTQEEMSSMHQKNLEEAINSLGESLKEKLRTKLEIKCQKRYTHYLKKNTRSMMIRTGVGCGITAASGVLGGAAGAARYGIKGSQAILNVLKVAGITAGSTASSLLSVDQLAKFGQEKFKKLMKKDK